MFTYNFDGVTVRSEEELLEKQWAGYAKYAMAIYPDAVEVIVSYSDDENGDRFADLEIHTPPKKFERIRRITGYLVGSLERFNDAKRSEVSDRVSNEAAKEVE